MITKQSNRLHRIGQLSCEDNDTNEVRLLCDA
nr:MAG TPA: hypothetical protein [Bacteriophage sp.]